MQTRALYAKSDWPHGDRFMSHRAGREESGRKMDGNGMEDSKERKGDKGEQTHAKLPPAGSGDPGSGDRAPTPLRRGGELQIVAGTSGGRGRGQLKIQLVIQRVQDAGGRECIVLWDSGAQVSLVTHEYARKAGLKRRPASIRITGVGAGSGGESSVQYKALLRRRDGSIAEILPYGVERITGNATSLNLSKAETLFPVAAGTWSPRGPDPASRRDGPHGGGPQGGDEGPGGRPVQLKVRHGICHGR